MLKKIAILTAAAGMLSTSMAVLAEGPTVHGRIAFGFKSVSGETDADDSQRIDDNPGSRFGFSGSNDLGNGMSVDYLLEYDANRNTDSRLRLRHANMSLNGSFGQFRLGQQTGVLYRYIGSNSDQSWVVGGPEWYAIAGKSDTNLNSDHSLRMRNIAAYRFGAGPGGDDPITFDIQVQSVDMSTAERNSSAATEGVGGETGVPITTRAVPAVTYKAAMDDSESIDSVTFAAATALGPVKLQVAYVDENGSDATGKRSPNLLSFGFRAPLGSAEVRGHMTQVDADTMEDRDDNKAWGLLVMNDFGGGYFGMIGVGSYTDGGKGDDGDGTAPAVNRNAGAGYTAPAHKNAGDMTNMYAMLTKSFGGGLSANVEYSTVSKTITKAIPAGQDVTDSAFTVDDDEENTNTLVLYLLQNF